MDRQGWFTTPGRQGDRTLWQQLTGLDPVLAEAAGAAVLDVGCAEGLISLELARYGARHVHGVEIVSTHVDVANRLRGDLPCSFEVADVNDWTPSGNYQIVLMLAILHKLRDPAAACARFAAACDDLCAIRLPPERAPVIVDPRSDNRPVDIAAVMDDAGFEHTLTLRGHLNEWCGYFRRRPWAN